MRTLVPTAICVLGAATLLDASETRVKMKDLPPAVRKTVQEQSKGATLRGLARETEDGKTFYEADLKINGHGKDVLIDPAGAIVEVEEEIPLASVPSPVQEAIRKYAGSGKILLVESVTKDGSVAYEAHVQKAGKKSEIKVDPAGRLLSSGQ